MTLSDFINQFTFPHECVFEPGHIGDMDYVVTENVPGDDGGPTKYGIDTASHPGIAIANLTADQATHIYMAEFGAVEWSLPNSPAALLEFPGVSSLAFFDGREVCGLHESWLFVQRSLGLPDDGLPGEQTRTAVLNALPGFLAGAIINQRRAYHRLLAEKYGHDREFLQGWLNRCDDLEKFLLG